MERRKDVTGSQAAAKTPAIKSSVVMGWLVDKQADKVRAINVNLNSELCLRCKRSTLKNVQKP